MNEGAGVPGTEEEENTSVEEGSQLSQGNTTSTTTTVTTSTVNNDSIQTSKSNTAGLQTTTTTTCDMQQGLSGGTTIYPYQSLVSNEVGVQGTAYGTNIPHLGDVHNAGPNTSDFFQKRGGIYTCTHTIYG